MPHKGYDNHFVTFWDKNPKQFKGCHLQIERYGCGHEDHTIFRCEDHAGLAKVDKRGKTYCQSLRMLDGKGPLTKNEDCPEHRFRENAKQVAAETKSYKKEGEMQTDSKDEQEGLDTLEATGFF